MEAAIDPDRPIVDPHHHLWEVGPLPDGLGDHPLQTILKRVPRYMFDDLYEDCRKAGHNVVATVYLQCGAFYRADGPTALRSLGEIEFANGVAAQAASGLYGRYRACDGIVGFIDLAQGAGQVASALDCAVRAGNGRLRGIRNNAAFDEDASILGAMAHAPEGLYGDAAFRAGFARLCDYGLTFDAFVLEPQIPEVTALARAFPDQPIVLDHLGTPLGIGRYAGLQKERFSVWESAIRELAHCPNVSIKIGGLMMGLAGFSATGPDHPALSTQLADIYRPYFDVAIDAFSARRAMFESNYPVDRWGSDYVSLWNAFKLLTQGASEEDKTWLFSRAACAFYGLELDELLAPGSQSGKRRRPCGRRNFSLTRPSFAMPADRPRR